MVSKSTDTTTRIWCGPDDPPRGRKTQYRFRLNSIPPKSNVFLKAENISDRMVRDLPALALDLLEVAAYIYCADQSKTRGGKTFPKSGADWYRKFELSIPVRSPNFWSSPKVVKSLKDLLLFLADDDYDFEFRQLEGDVERETYFDFEEGRPWFKPDSILLFSGGLDSLTGALEELQDPDRRVLLVSHRPVAKIDKAQRDLVQLLRDRFNAKSRLLHIPVWVNKEKGITKDANQRSRSFLYASIATVLAMLTDTRTIKFYENGIVSCNLPVSDQVVGARASRTTRPETSNFMSTFFSAVVQDEFSVVNPFWDKTKTDVLAILKSRDVGDLVKWSHSCTRTRSTTKIHTHCGVCSQCIERRLAVLANEMEDHDPEEAYHTELFLDPLPNRDDVVMVESYVRHAQRLENLDIDSFYQVFPNVFNLVPALKLPYMQAGQAIFELHRRHGEQVGAVIDKQIKLHSHRIRVSDVPPKSLLGMIVGSASKKERRPYEQKIFNLPDGLDWEDIRIDIVSNDSVVIHAGNINKRFHGFDLGFRDGRRVDMLNRQWDLLESFARNEGVLNWESEGLKRPTSKRVEELNKTLKKFFGLPDNPIRPYKRGVGWVTRFKIKDRSFGKS